MDSKTLERAKYIKYVLSDLARCITDSRIEFGGFYISTFRYYNDYIHFRFPKECRSEIIDILKKWKVKLESELKNL